MATPLTTRLNALPAQAATDHLVRERYGNQRTSIVTKRPAALLDLLNLGLKLDILNVGTMPQTDITKQTTRQINVGERDVEGFKKITDKDVEITAQLTPSDDSHDFTNLMSEKIKQGV